jgi:EAL domain-containing protein (putative c-di-GMP-specific phosphodiesterase class I)
MSDSTVRKDSASSDERALGEAAQRLAATQALGVVLVDAGPLTAIEIRYGHDAYRQAMRKLGAAVVDALDAKLRAEAVLACGATGRSDVALFLARPSGEESFYLKTLPRTAEDLRRRLERSGPRIAYPYLRTLPSLAVGSGLVLRNPRLSAIRQVQSLLEQARADAALNAQIARRERRRRLLGVILAGKVSSVFEPIVDAKKLTVFGYEALARGPEGSEFASAAVLFSVATEEDLLFELDCLCRHKALEGAIDFPSGTKLFLNVRPMAIHDPSFQPDALKRTLDRCGLSPSDVVFEISEQESIENYEIFREARDEYGKQGFQFALDDTGAGYASLEAVMELNPEFIKVDRAFVSGINEDPARQAMVRAFQALAERMGSRLVGEGLDTLEELRTLGDMGIHFGQGWLFGKPHPLRGKEPL